MPVNTTFMQEFQEILRERNLDFDAKTQHFHCIAHIVNLAVQDVIKMLQVDACENNENSMDDDESAEEDGDEDHCDDADNIENKSDLHSLVKLRYLCKKIKKSEQMKNKLRECCLFFDEKLIDLPLDVRTRWNSTHDLIAAGLRMQKSLSDLASSPANPLMVWLMDSQGGIATCRI